MKQVVGVVLAGGKSSRMGKNKALLDFRGKPLVVHMCDLLRTAGVDDVVISGAVQGYETIPDETPHEGPARAMAWLLQMFLGRAARLLFVPVDMPFLTTDTLRRLAAQPGNVYTEGHLLPLCLAPAAALKAESIYDLLEEVSAKSINMEPDADGEFANLNTPVEWQRFVEGAAWPILD